MKTLRGRIIDGAGNPPIPDGIVLIEGERIAAVGPASAFDALPEESRLDAPGITIMPGVIDSHVHIGLDRTSRQQCLLNGVTGVCDLGSRRQDMAAWKTTAEVGEHPIARGFQSGPVFTVPGGLPGVLFQEGLNYEVQTAAEARAGVQDLVHGGADVIKVYLDPWAGRYFPVLQPGMVKCIIEAAHDFGLLVRAHVNKIPVLKYALDAGVDVLEHVPLVHPGAAELQNIPFGDPNHIPQFFVEQMAILEDLLPRLVAQGIILVPTLSKLERSLRGSLIPEHLQPRVFYSALETVGHFHEIGGRVALGTDRNARWEKPLGMPIREMALLQESGLSSMDVILAGTRHAAAACGQSQELGTLEVGKLADILLVDGDPLQDLQVLKKVRAVFLGGKEVFLQEG
jgi:enamidase